MRNPKWYDQMKPFAGMYADFVRRVKLAVRQLPDVELRKLKAACGYPSESNCPADTYRARDTVRTAVLWELVVRKSGGRRAT
jgi:hypothetical protein